ncbi:TetR/AcrR family transcriptional regulator [Streptomyces spectabilis]|uniref:TetR/AcrR family transcriptional regulator n=1 Tax=Streptomyces spectabilis TaxID=68270 RepID=A0A5P2X7B0_STRST|nr:TetR/AcrR family transcriptional regulator [Streptomyces spectabilis]MBB5104055.1 TetR/AcrR family transcriptional repressor of nem operon [Streptomyces spectabilis]MCI3903711.1 TetR/AcrR family transcriptional regulator [Streptomyces spectabilis]QEV60893.1 TetR/AcrR family transcriptional regulator [Streptomyces spectabilis]
MGRPRQFDPETAVEQAMEVFWRKGYAGTTPQDLVDALGIGKGSLYNAFGSKHAVFERALRRYRDTQASRLIELFESEGPVKERLRAALELLVTLDLADPDRRGCMAVNAAAELAGSDRTTTELVRDMFARTESTLQALVEEGKRAGEIAPDRDAACVGSLLMNTVVGLRLTARVADGPDGMRRTIRAVLDLL